MEYSVYDLIRILLRKWYLILLVMCIAAGLSVFFSQRSFTSVEAGYQEYTTQTIPSEELPGTLTNTYQCSFSVTDISRYQRIIGEQYAFLEKYLSESAEGYSGVLNEDTLYAQAQVAYSYAKTDFASILTGEPIWTELRAFSDKQGYMEPAEDASSSDSASSARTALVVVNHFSAQLDTNGKLTLTVTDLPEDTANALVDAYWQEAEQIGRTEYFMEISRQALTSEYVPQRSSFTDDALLSQTVMQAPESAPLLVKAAATGAVFAFLFACFGVLLYTFIKDSRRQAAAEAGTEGHA